MIQIDKMLDGTYAENTIDWLAYLATEYRKITNGISYIDIVKKMNRMKLTPLERVVLKQYVCVLAKQPNDNMELLYGMLISDKSLNTKASIKPIDISINSTNQYRNTDAEFIHILGTLGIRETTFLIAALCNV